MDKSFLDSSPYKSLIQDYQDKRISIEDFRRKFVELYEKEPINVDEQRVKAQEYGTLIQNFLGKRISIEDFVQQYLYRLKNEPGRMDNKLFVILQDLFEDIDAYSPDCTKEDESPLCITEESLRDEAATSLNQLERYLSDFPNH